MTKRLLIKKEGEVIQYNLIPLAIIMLLYLNSGVSGNGRGNTPSSFTCFLPERYDLNTRGRGSWSLGLTEICLPQVTGVKNWESIYVLCSVCQSSALGERYKPVLASLCVGEVKKQNFVRIPSVTYVPLRVNSLSEITVNISGFNGELVKIQETNGNGEVYSTTCTVDLKWMKDIDLWRP